MTMKKKTAITTADEQLLAALADAFGQDASR